VGRVRKDEREGKEEERRKEVEVGNPLNYITNC
jgi:hypothetical protein